MTDLVLVLLIDVLFFVRFADLFQSADRCVCRMDRIDRVSSRCLSSLGESAEWLRGGDFCCNS